MIQYKPLTRQRCIHAELGCTCNVLLLLLRVVVELVLGVMMVLCSLAT